jgi:uncharacterized membrane protein
VALLDHNGESELPFSKDKVFDALSIAIPSIKGMKIETSDKLLGRITVKAGMSLFSWGENIPIQLTSISEERTKIQITSSPKTGVMFGGAFDMGKNRKNIEQILLATSSVLSNNQVIQTTQTTIEQKEKIMSEQVKKGFNWKYLIPFYGFYLIYKSDDVKKGMSYFLNVVVTLIIIGIIGGDENKTSSSATNAQNQTATAEVKIEATTGKFSKENYNKIKNGMTQAQVKEILGDPDSTSESEIPGFGKTDMWHFQDTSIMTNSIEACEIYFQNGKVNMKNWLKL